MGTFLNDEADENVHAEKLALAVEALKDIQSYTSKSGHLELFIIADEALSKIKGDK